MSTSLTYDNAADEFYAYFSEEIESDRGKPCEVTIWSDEESSCLGFGDEVRILWYDCDGDICWHLIQNYGEKHPEREHGVNGKVMKINDDEAEKLGVPKDSKVLRYQVGEIKWLQLLGKDGLMGD
jgi:hypothetical protein